MLLSDMFNNYYSYAEVYNAPGTLRFFRETFHSWIKYFGDVDSSVIGKNEILNYIKESQQRLSNNTINKRILFLKKVFRYNNVQADFLELKKLKEKFVTYGYINESTLKKLYYEIIPNLKIRTKLIIMLLLDTGSRATEFVNIKTKNVDLENRCILLEKTKTGNPRIVYFTSQTTSVLKKYLKKHNHEYLFDSAKSVSHISVSALESMFCRLRKKYGLTNFSPHRLRHTLSTNLYSNGSDLLFIMSVLGHSNMNTTKRYIHENKDLNLKLYDKYKIKIKKSP